MLLILSFNFSCRKEYSHAPVTIDSIPQSQTGKVSQQFFNSHLSSDENIIAVRNNILRQNQQKPFIDQFVKFAGYPIWDRAVIKTIGENSTATSNSSRGITNGKIIFMPLALDTQHRVNAVLEVKIAANDTTFHVLYKWQYNNNGYTDNTKSNSANQTALLFMGLESYTFGHQDFKLNDTLLLKGIRVTDTVHIKTFNKDASERVALLQQVKVHICYAVSCSPTTRLSSSGYFTCENCADFYEWEDDGTGSGGGGTGGRGGGTGGGGGGWQDDPCNPSGGSNIPPTRIGQLAPCDGGGSSGGDDPWLPVLPDDNTLVPPSQDQINAAIKDQPFALFPDVPCETIKQWLAIATFKPSSAIINKLNSVYNIITIPGTSYDQPAMTFDDIARVQSINDAYSRL